MANRFWVGGTDTWNSTAAAKWGTLSGVADSASLPGTGDAVIFDALSGGGTVTVDSPNGAGVVTVQSITMGAFTGTLDFSANNNNVTLSSAFDGSGTGTRTFNMGNGTWTIQGFNNNTWNYTTVTGLTHNPNSSTLSFIPSTATPTGAVTFQGGGKSFNIVTYSGVTNANPFKIVGSPTIATLQFTAPGYILFTSGTTTAITNAFAWVGTSSNQFYFASDSTATSATIAAAAGSTIQWSGLQRLTFTGNTVLASNSFDLRSNSGVTITPPSTSGGGARIISG